MYQKVLKRGLYLLSVLALVACTPHYRDSPAPVDDHWEQPSRLQTTHTVRPGDTLYSIAWRYGADYRYLARLNHLRPPYAVAVGQTIKVRASAESAAWSHSTSERVTNSANYSAEQTPLVHDAITPALTVHKIKNINKSVAALPREKTSPVTAAKKEIVYQPVNDKSQGFMWPAKGKLIGKYSLADGRKGIDIAGRKGDPIYSAASGVVVYAGSGLRGYGQLVIIKHNSANLTAYGHCNKILVKEGQQVNKGQRIADIGDSAATQPMLHFEIRVNGNSVNPLKYLPRR